MMCNRSRIEITRESGLPANVGVEVVLRVGECDEETLGLDSYFSNDPRS